MRQYQGFFFAIVPQYPSTMILLLDLDLPLVLDLGVRQIFFRQRDNVRDNIYVLSRHLIPKFHTNHTFFVNNQIIYNGFSNPCIFSELSSFIREESNLYH